MILALTSLAFGVVWILYARLSAPYDSIISPVTIFGFGCVFYALAVPLQLALQETGRIGNTGWTLLPEVGEKAALLTLAGFISFGASYLVFVRGVSAAVPDNASQLEIPWRVVSGITIVWVIVGVIFFRENILASRDYYANIAQTSATSDSPLYFIWNRWAYVLLGILAFMVCAFRQRVYAGILGLVPLVAWSLYTNDKDPALIAVISALGFTIRPGRVRRIGSLRLLAGGALVLTIFAFGAAAFSSWRATDDLAVTGDSRPGQGYFAAIDPAGPAVVISRVLREDSRPTLGDSVASGLVSWIPFVDLPFEQTDLASQFAQRNYPNYRPGFGYGYSPLAEGWIIGGIAGVFFLFAVLGAVTAVARNWMVRRRSVTDSTRVVLSAGAFVVLGYTSFIAMRGTFASFVLTLVYLLLMLAGLRLAISVATRTRGRHA